MLSHNVSSSQPDNRLKNTAGVLLAAGSGSRFKGRGNKLLAPFRSKSVIEWSLQSLSEAGFGTAFVVIGPVDFKGLVPAGLTVLRNDKWQNGLASSLAVALQAADSEKMEAVVVGLADQPLVPAAAWRNVGLANGPIVSANFEGLRRPPVKIERQVWSLLPKAGDIGARTLMMQRPDLLSEVACSGSPNDIDTQEDLQQWS